MRPHRIAAALLFFAVAAPALAEVSELQNLTQQEFRALSEDLGAALSYKPLAPISPLGVTGFDIGLAVTTTSIRNRELFERASGGAEFPERLVAPSIRVAKGLPWNFDAALMYSALPKAGMNLWGGALSWAFVPGDALLPAMGVRASYTRLYGVDQLDFTTAGLDASVSKGFGPLTPYAGVGKVWSASTPQGTTGLIRESFAQNKVFAGLGITLAMVNLVMEYDRTGDRNTYGAKLGLRF